MSLKRHWNTKIKHNLMYNFRVIYITDSEEVTDEVSEVADIEEDSGDKICGSITFTDDQYLISFVDCDGLDDKPGIPVCQGTNSNFFFK